MSHGLFLLKIVKGINFMRTIILLSSVILLFRCSAGKDKEQSVRDEVDKEEPTNVISKDTLGLVVLYPAEDCKDI